MPAFGLGTLHLADNEVSEVLRLALQYGFRCIDTSPVYGNEKAIGQALSLCIKEGLVKREDLFITSKLWFTDRNNVKDAVR